ncbi:MAG: hypothetical protein ACE5HE_15290 [Phycisphaerae bacterium]
MPLPKSVKLHQPGKLFHSRTGNARKRHARAARVTDLVIVSDVGCARMSCAVQVQAPYDFLREPARPVPITEKPLVTPYRRYGQDSDQLVSF